MKIMAIFVFTINMLNPNIIKLELPLPIIYTYIAFVFTSLVLFVLMGKIKITTNVLVVLLFILSFLPSVIFSFDHIVSSFKYVLFSIGIISVYGVFFIFPKYNGITKIEKSILTIRNFNRFLLITSVGIFFLGLGYPRNETGFAGIFNHPQSAGICFGLIALLEFYLLLPKKRPSLINVAFFGLSIVCVVATESRTSFLALIISCGLCFLIYLFRGNTASNRSKYIKVFMIFILFISLSPFLFQLFASVLAKGGDEQSITSAFQDSRMFLAYASYLNFNDSPLYGIGFQVSNGLYGHYVMDVSLDPVLGIPTKAAIEKGVFVAALFEETGVIGGSGFCIFIVWLLYKSKWSTFSIVFVCSVFLSSVGESMMLTLGGVGFICWFYLFFASRYGREIDDLFYGNANEKNCIYNR